MLMSLYAPKVCQQQLPAPVMDSTTHKPRQAGCGEQYSIHHDLETPGQMTLYQVFATRNDLVTATRVWRALIKQASYSGASACSSYRQTHSKQLNIVFQLPPYEPQDLEHLTLAQRRPHATQLSTVSV